MAGVWEKIGADFIVRDDICMKIFGGRSYQDMICMATEHKINKERFQDPHMKEAILRVWHHLAPDTQLFAMKTLKMTEPECGMIAPNGNRLSYEQEMALLEKRSEYVRLQLRLEKNRSVSNATSETTDVEMVPVDDAKSREENRIRELEAELAKVKEENDLLKQRDRANLSNLSASRILVRRVFIHERFPDTSGVQSMYFRYPDRFKDETALYEPIIGFLKKLKIPARRADNERLGHLPEDVANAIFQHFRIGGCTDLRLELGDALIEVKISKRVSKSHKRGCRSPNTTQLPSDSTAKRRGRRKIYPTTASQIQVIKQALNGPKVKTLQRLSATKETNGLSAHLPQGLGQLILSQLAAPNSKPFVLITSFDRNDKSLLLFFANRDAVINHLESIEDEFEVAIEHRMDIDDEEDDAKEEWQEIANTKKRLEELRQSCRDRVNEHVAVVSTISYEKMIAVLRSTGESTGWDLFDDRTPATSDSLSLFKPSISSSTTSGGDSSNVLSNTTSCDWFDNDSDFESEPEPKRKRKRKKKKKKKERSAKRTGLGKGKRKPKKKKRKRVLLDFSDEDSMTGQVQNEESSDSDDLVILNKQST